MFEPIKIEEKPIAENISVNEILKLRVLPSDIIPKPDPVLFFGDEMVMTRKNISCVTGKAKVGKTFLMTLLNIAVLEKGEFENTLKSFLPKGKDKILYFDTEQSDYHILLILKRIKDVVSEKKIENLYMFNFDALDVVNRREYIKTLLYSMPDVGLIVIDGIADLIFDTNDIRESSLMVSDLRKWSVENDVHITCVLHQNPSESTKMRGHLGTILTNKSETVIQISSSKENESIKLVETLATRNKKPENWSFEILDGQPKIMNETFIEPIKGRKPIKTFTDDERYSILSEIYTTISNEKGLGYTILLERIKEATNLGIVNSKDFFKYCVEMAWIVQDVPRGNYFLYPKIMLK